MVKDGCTLECILCKDQKHVLVFIILTLICLFLSLPFIGKLKFHEVTGSTNGSATKDVLPSTGEKVGSGKSVHSKKIESSVNENVGRKTTEPYRQTSSDKAPFYRKNTKPDDTGKLPFLKNYRNPCWRELREDRSDTWIRCLPYFYLVGAPKCGTTDLYKRLTKHPLISKIVQKEQHWLTRKRFTFREKGKLSSYLEYFDEAVQKDISKVERNNYHPMIFGDGSASTLWDNRILLQYHQDTSMTVPPFTNADLIYRLNPDAKILIMLRNPVTRLYSEYLFFQEYDKSVDDFHNHVVSSLHLYKDCANMYSLRYCAYFLQPALRIQVGFYHIYIEDYFRVFPREQVKILKLEEYSHHIREYMTDVYTFLGVGRSSDETMIRVEQRKHAKARKETNKKLGEMLPKTWKLLADFYKPFNERLVELLGDKFGYN